MTTQDQKPSDSQMRAMIDQACEDLGRHGLQATDEAAQVVLNLIVSASELGRLVDLRPPRCLDCGALDEFVRPGKTQPSCDCHETCHVHGKNKIVYHTEGEFPGVCGYFCAECLVDPSTRERDDG